MERLVEERIFDDVLNIITTEWTDKHVGNLLSATQIARMRPPKLASRLVSISAPDIVNADRDCSTRSEQIPAIQVNIACLSRA